MLVERHQSRINFASRNKRLDLVPPCLLMYATAVLLSHITRTCLVATSDLKDTRASLVASNSSKLMANDLHGGGHLPEAVAESVGAPQPSRDASVKIVRSLVDGTKVWRTIKFDQRDHQFSTSRSLGRIGISCIGY